MWAHLGCFAFKPVIAIPVRVVLNFSIGKIARLSTRFKEDLLNPLLEPLFSKWRRGNIAMFHIGRSGSTVLGNLLDQDTNIRWDGELCPDIFQALDCTEERRLALHELKPLLGRTTDLLDRIRHGQRRAGTRFYGVELKFFHLYAFDLGLSECIERLSGLGFDHFIILERRNYLRKIVSSVVAKETGMYHVKHGCKSKLNRISLNVEQVSVDRQTMPLLEFLVSYQECFRQLEQLLKNRKYLKLTYEEDILVNPKVAYGKVCSFLGIEGNPVEVNLSKTNPYPLSDVIENFDDVSKHLEETSFKWMLHDD